MTQHLLTLATSQKYTSKLSEIKLLATGFSHATGPVWHPGGYLLFSTSANNKIFQLFENKVMHVYLPNSGGMYISHQHLSELTGSNGLALDEELNLIFCQHGSHGIAKMDKEKNVVQLCGSYNGRPFNSPADLTIKSNGAIYFTDPSFGLKGKKLNEDIFQPFAGVYRYYNNSVSLLINDLSCPAGICFSPDEKYLYVSNNAADEPYIFRYRLTATGAIMGKQQFARINAGGIKTDKLGNLYAATGKGIVVLDENGNERINISLPERPTNIAFGGNTGKTIFITTAKSVFSADLTGLQPLPLPSVDSRSNPDKTVFATM